VATRKADTAGKKRKGARQPQRYRIKISQVGEPSVANVIAAQLTLLGYSREDVRRAVAEYKERWMEQELKERREELEKIDYRRRLPIDGLAFETAAGRWLAVVDKYEEQRLCYYNVRYGIVRFEPQFAGGRVRRVGLWVDRGMLLKRGQFKKVAECITNWLDVDESDGEYTCSRGELSEFTPVWPELPDDLLGLAGARLAAARAALEENPEMRVWAEAFLKARELKAYKFTGETGIEEFEAHWERVRALRVERNALEVAVRYEQEHDGRGRGRGRRSVLSWRPQDS
jgi:hypothetical protein